jgi:hypothetical protein
MRVIPADTRATSWAASGGRSGSFRPNGKLTTVGDAALAPNPTSWRAKSPMLAARLFVGFNVGSKPRWHVDDLIRIVKATRKKQGHPQDASFLLQKGVYTSRQSGKTVTENGSQVVLLNIDGVSLKAFEAEMLALAEGVAEKLKQEEVIVEIQKGGIAVRTFGVVP